jgi:hypothetical protein
VLLVAGNYVKAIAEGCAFEHEFEVRQLMNSDWWEWMVAIAAASGASRWSIAGSDQRHVPAHAKDSHIAAV